MSETPMTFERATPALCDYFEGQCNRFVNGHCDTLRCVRRGEAANPGTAPLRDRRQLATCEEFEVAHIIASIIGRQYGPNYQPNPKTIQRGVIHG